ncbi:MAG: hypothetical protein R3E96_16075 [Planctomycetota bacterium]
MADSGALDCARCHGPELAYDAGHLQRSACADCHEDPHGDGFDQGSLARVVADLAGTPREGCERCHSLEVDAWKPAPGFDHAVATGFFLKEKHAELNCELCHCARRTNAPSGKPCSRARARRAAAFLRPHAGAFASGVSAMAAGTDCASCHNERDFRSKTSTTTGPGTS